VKRDGFLSEQQLKKGFKRISRNSQKQFMQWFGLLERPSVIQVLTKCSMKLAKGRTARETFDFDSNTFLIAFGSNKTFCTKINFKLCAFVFEPERVAGNYLPTLFFQGATNSIVKGISSHDCSSLSEVSDSVID
jgi:hypothetical protein